MPPESNQLELLPPDAGGMSFDLWLERVGISRTTGWEWRQKNWIKTVKIAGRVYVRTSAILEFWKRVEAGEFDTPTETIADRMKRKQETEKAA